MKTLRRLGLAVAFALWPLLALAAGEIDNFWQCAPGSTTQPQPHWCPQSNPYPAPVTGPTLTPVFSAAAEASHVLKASAGTFYWGSAANVTATAGFCLVINATAAPTSGSTVAPLLFATLPASGTCTIAIGPSAAATFSTGIVFLVSSNASPFTFTSGVITAAISGFAQ